MNLSFLGKTNKWIVHDIIKNWIDSPNSGKNTGMVIKDWVTTNDTVAGKSGKSDFQGFQTALEMSKKSESKHEKSPEKNKSSSPRKSDKKSYIDIDIFQKSDKVIGMV